MSYQAEARIVCRITGTSTAVTLPGRTSPLPSQPTFGATPIAQRLFLVPPAGVDVVPDDDAKRCLEKARGYVSSELPAAYGVDAANASPVPGHALIEGHWVHTSPAFVAYSFPLLRNGEPIEEECTIRDGQGGEQSVTLSWNVMVQPR